MPLTRRHLLSAGGAVGGALLLPGPPAAARGGDPDDWLGRLRAHRRHVAAVVDDGRGGRLAHRPHARQPLGSAVQVLHLAAYALAVERGVVAPDDRVTAGEWEAHHLGAGLDGGAHQRALRTLGLASTNGVTADDPHAVLTLDDLVGVLLRHGDHAAADHLGRRLAGLVRPAAVRAGWPDAPVPSYLGEGLRLVLGRRVEVERYLDDPRLQLEVVGHLPDVPKTYDGRRAWARDTWRGTAAGLHRLHRALDRFPGAVARLERGREVPDAVGFQGGSLPGVVTAGLRVRWPDGRVGTATVLVEEADEPWSRTAGGLVELVRRALLDPAALGELQAALA
ncbi:hypothetical protein [Saccharothrix australiensis]|uniref:Beta-lactamase family protein n=1 Tax=Saccharothrix australiensis TaxID=2072 RepID=A0A495VXZ6_9PSEU|nr:hypothetical protein [Saccharothrix australiensis]RKT53255.1 hypothetical protein C8E97_1814 [Saccharothrix australiensis]